MASGRYPEEGGGGSGTLESVASADGSVVVTDGTGPDVDLSVIDEVTVTLGAAATKITVPSLVGADDGNYIVRGHLVCTGAFAGKITFKPNDVATNQISGGSSVSAGTVTGFSDTVLVICEPGAAIATIDFLIRFESITGKTRLFVSNCVYNSTPVWSNGQWNSAATAITSLVVQSSNANAIDAGSYVTVRKLHETT
jgi:hypothetical protein